MTWSWFSGLWPEDLEALLAWREDIDLHTSQDPQVNMRYMRWLKLAKDYDVDIVYHLGTTNVAIECLSRKWPTSTLT